MKFDSQQNIYEPTIKIMFSKLLPFLLIMNENSKSKLSELKNDGDTLLEVMNVIKKVYNIKFEVYGDTMKSNFQISEENIDIKNDLLNSLGTLLVQNQNCKKIFVKSKFINTFIDYIYQLQSYLLNDSINQDKKKFKCFIGTKFL